MFKINGQEVVIFFPSAIEYPARKVDNQNEITINLDNILIDNDNEYIHGVFAFYNRECNFRNNWEEYYKFTIRIIDKKGNRLEVGCIQTDKNYIITDININQLFIENYNRDGLNNLVNKYLGKKILVLQPKTHLLHTTNTVRLAGKDPESLVNGEGLRKVIFFQGCSLKCKGCFNECTHDFNGGEEFKITEVFDDICKDELINGVTFSGGNPVEQPYQLATLLYHCHSSNINSWVYSGFTFEELLEKIEYDESINSILFYSNVMVDGRYIEEQKEEGLKYKGSKNQRIIDVRQSLLTGNIVEWCNDK